MLLTSASTLFMAQESLTNCQLNCCPLPQPAPVFALVCHLMVSLVLSPRGLLTRSHMSQITSNNKSYCLHPLNNLNKCVFYFELFTTVSC